MKHVVVSMFRQGPAFAGLEVDGVFASREDAYTFAKDCSKNLPDRMWAVTELLETRPSPDTPEEGGE